MKRLLSFLTIFICLTNSTVSIVACDNGGDNHLAPATSSQMTNALKKFISESQELRSPVRSNSISFNPQKAISNLEKIYFQFELSENSPILEYSQLVPEYRGAIVYNMQDKSFKMLGQPFKQPALYAPGYMTLGLGLTSTIFGNSNDFTIVATGGRLEAFVNALWDSEVTSLKDLFKFIMKWSNVAQFSGLTLTNLKNLVRSHSWAWQISKLYTAVIHVKKINNQYKIVWSNLATHASKMSLPNSQQGINAFFWKSTLASESNSAVFNLWAGRSFMEELIQLYQLGPEKNNYWFQNKNLSQWLLYPPETKDALLHFDSLEIANVNYSAYDQYNASSNEAILAIQNLMSSNKNIKDLQKFLLQQVPKTYNKDKNYPAFNLVFEKIGNSFRFSEQDSHGLT